MDHCLIFFSLYIPGPRETACVPWACSFSGGGPQSHQRWGGMITMFMAQNEMFWIDFDSWIDKYRWIIV